MFPNRKVSLAALVAKTQKNKPLNIKLFFTPMAINYKVVGCINPKGAEGVEYACNRRTKTGDLTLDGLVALVSEATTVTDAEVKGILKAYFTEITNRLADGNPVEMEGIGTFNPGIRSKCFAQSVIGQDGFNPRAFIRGVRLTFHCNAALKRHIRSYRTLKRVPSELMA